MTDALIDYLEAMRQRDGTLESAQHLDDLWHKMSAEERQQAHRELQMRPGQYDVPRETIGDTV